jgi:hypothetical protein
MASIMKPISLDAEVPLDFRVVFFLMDELPLGVHQAVLDLQALEYRMEARDEHVHSRKDITAPCLRQAVAPVSGSPQPDGGRHAREGLALDPRNPLAPRVQGPSWRRAAAPGSGDAESLAGDPLPMAVWPEAERVHEAHEAMPAPSRHGTMGGAAPKISYEISVRVDVD